MQGLLQNLGDVNLRHVAVLKSDAEFHELVVKFLEHLLRHLTLEVEDL